MTAESRGGGGEREIKSWNETRLTTIKHWNLVKNTTILSALITRILSQLQEDVNEMGTSRLFAQNPTGAN